MSNYMVSREELKIRFDTISRLQDEFEYCYANPDDEKAFYSAMSELVSEESFSLIATVFEKWTCQPRIWFLDKMLEHPIFKDAMILGHDAACQAYQLFKHPRMRMLG